MAVTESPETVGIRPFHEFDESRETWPRGRRLGAIREGAETFRTRFKAQGRVRAVRTIDLVTAAYPTRFALAGAAKGLNPYVGLTNRMVVVQFDDFEGRLRTLVWEPTLPEGSARAPFYAALIERYGDTLSNRVFAEHHNTVEEGLAMCGLTTEDVDLVAFDHLHVQDVRSYLGTTKPVEGEPAARAPMFPRARFLAQRLEVDTFRAVHPMQWAWYVPGGMDDVIEDQLVLLDGDVELGAGLALVSTPGHTDGNQSLCLHTPDGVWVSSENGVAADSWQPHISKIPGVRRYAEFWNREVVLNANTLEDSIDQYDSMVKEKCLADASQEDPRFGNVLPSSEMSSARRFWPVVPTFTHGGIDCGRIERPAAPR